MKSLLLSFFILFLYSFSLPAQENTANWLKTEATIIEVNNKRRAKNTRAFAKVSFVAEDGKAYEAKVELLAIPLFGTTKSIGDSITILYNPKTPILAKSIGSSFLERYGLYLLIGAGILISFMRLKKVYSQKNT